MLVVAYMLMGLGLTGATLLPAALIIANWFGERRGLAMGMTFAGTSFGGAVMTLVAAAPSHGGGWRSGYLVLAIPMFVIVIPIVLIMIRTRPDDAGPEERRFRSREVGRAARLRAVGGVSDSLLLDAVPRAVPVMRRSPRASGLHFIPYMIGLAYKAEFAAGMMSIVFLFTTAGKLIMGFASDRISPRVALIVNFIGATIGMVLIFGARNPCCSIRSSRYSGSL